MSKIQLLLPDVDGLTYEEQMNVLYANMYMLDENIEKK